MIEIVSNANDFYSLSLLCISHRREDSVGRSDTLRCAGCGSCPGLPGGVGVPGAAGDRVHADGLSGSAA